MSMFKYTLKSDLDLEMPNGEKFSTLVASDNTIIDNFFDVLKQTLTEQGGYFYFHESKDHHIFRNPELPEITVTIDSEYNYSSIDYDDNKIMKYTLQLEAQANEHLPLEELFVIFTSTGDSLVIQHENEFYRVKSNSVRIEDGHFVADTCSFDNENSTNAQDFFWSAHRLDGKNLAMKRPFYFMIEDKKVQADVFRNFSSPTIVTK